MPSPQQIDAPTGSSDFSASITQLVNSQLWNLPVVSSGHRLHITSHPFVLSPTRSQLPQLSFVGVEELSLNTVFFLLLFRSGILYCTGIATGFKIFLYIVLKHILRKSSTTGKNAHSLSPLMLGGDKWALQSKKKLHHVTPYKTTTCRVYISLLDWFNKYFLFNGWTCKSSHPTRDILPSTAPQQNCFDYWMTHDYITCWYKRDLRHSLMMHVEKVDHLSVCPKIKLSAWWPKF